MEVLAFNGSPRKGGNTEVLMRAAVDGLVAAGHKVESIRLNDLDFRPCQNCGGCDPTGVCVLRDDLTPLYEKILSSRCFIFATPIYFYGPSAQTKMMIDRMQALWNRKRLLRKEGRWKQDQGRRGILLAVAATGGARLFDGAILAVRYGLDAMGAEYMGEVCATGVDHRGAMARHPVFLQQAAALADSMIAQAAGIDRAG